MWESDPLVVVSRVERRPNLLASSSKVLRDARQATRVTQQSTVLTFIGPCPIFVMYSGLRPYHHFFGALPFLWFPGTLSALRLLERTCTRGALLT